MPRGLEKIQPKYRFGLVIEPESKDAEIEVFNTLEERCIYADVLRDIKTPFCLFPGPAVDFLQLTCVDK